MNEDSLLGLESCAPQQMPVEIEMAQVCSSLAGMTQHLKMASVARHLNS